MSLSALWDILVEAGPALGGFAAFLAIISKPARKVMKYVLLGAVALATWVMAALWPRLAIITAVSGALALGATAYAGGFDRLWKNPGPEVTDKRGADPGKRKRPVVKPLPGAREEGAEAADQVRHQERRESAAALTNAAQ